MAIIHPWNDLEYNLFIKDVWIPSGDLLAARDNVSVDLETKDLMFNVPIKHSFDFAQQETPVSMSKPGEAIFEPSYPSTDEHNPKA